MATINTELGPAGEPARRWFKVYDDELEQLAKLKGARPILAVLGLLKHADELTREAYPTCETIGRRVNIAPNHVSSALKEAEQAGVIEGIGKVKRTIRYRVCAGSNSAESSRRRDQSPARDQSRRRESVPPVDGSKLLPQTGDRTDHKQNYEQPPARELGGHCLEDADAPTLFALTEDEPRPELGKTEKPKRPRLSPELSKHADRIVEWASENEKVQLPKSASQVVHIRDVMKAWVGTPVEGHLHSGKFWGEVLRSTLVWWKPTGAGTCGIGKAMAGEAAKALHRKRDQHFAEAARADERRKSAEEAERLRDRAKLEERAQAGDQDAIDELWGRVSEVQSAS